MPEQGKKFTVSVPESDVEVLNWFEAQDNNTVSLRLLIKEDIIRHGYTDVLTRGFDVKSSSRRVKVDTEDDVSTVTSDIKSKQIQLKSEKKNKNESSERSPNDNESEDEVIVEQNLEEKSKQHKRSKSIADSLNNFDYSGASPNDMLGSIFATEDTDPEEDEEIKNTDQE